MKISGALQLKPASCKKSLNFESAFAALNDGLFAQHSAEEKFDGIRYLWQIRPDGQRNYLTSRRVSVVTNRYVEKQDSVPQMRDYQGNIPPFTIFDGEVVCEGISSDTQHAMVTGDVHYQIWDILYFGGKDIRALPYFKRRRFLEELEADLPSFVTLVNTYASIETFLKRVQKENKEGIVIKDQTSPYGQGWTKVKMEKHADVIIYGFGKTKSADWKARNWIGAILIGQWRELLGNGSKYTSVPYKAQEIPTPGMLRKFGDKCLKFVALGSASGFDQELREKMSKRPQDYHGRVIEVEYQLRFPTGRFRSPRFNRFREDKNPWECLLNLNHEG